MMLEHGGKQMQIIMDKRADGTVRGAIVMAKAEEVIACEFCKAKDVEMYVWVSNLTSSRKPRVVCRNPKCYRKIVDEFNYLPLPKTIDGTPLAGSFAPVTEVRRSGTEHIAKESAEQEQDEG